ncbi:EVE domain-containing protein [soil metagenome]
MTDPAGTRYWVSTISLDHVLQGIEGGFTQADHGRDTRLRRLTRGDRIAFYSPRTALGSGKPLQQLTAAGVIADDEPYRVEMAPDFHPWRRRVDFEEVRAVPIRPLLPLLGFIDDEQKWGLPFRRGLFEVPAGDFGVIVGALRDAAGVDDVFSASGRRAEA